MSRLAYGGASDAGRVRDRNEDRWYASRSRGLFIVADGVAGEFEGALAARVVVEALPRMIEAAAANLTDLAAEEARRAFASAIQNLSERVKRSTHGEPGLEGMGATVVAVVIDEPHALIAHMGDSRAYLLRDGSLELLTKDHTIVQMLIDTGRIKPEEAATHPSKGRLSRYVGMPGEPLPDARHVDVRPGDTVLLCSDGLTDMLADERIESVLRDGGGPEAVARDLVAAANHAGGKDNVTAVVVALEGATE